MKILSRLTRRHFYLSAIYGLWSLMGAALALPASIYLLFPPRARKTEEWVEAGDISSLQTGQPDELVFRRTRVDGWKITSEKTSAWVLKVSSNEVVAFAPQCTHLGCAYHWDAQAGNFLCPCHTTTFGIDGRVLTGPAPRPLDRYHVKVEGNRLLLGAIEKQQNT